MRVPQATEGPSIEEVYANEEASNANEYAIRDGNRGCRGVICQIRERRIVVFTPKNSCPFMRRVENGAYNPKPEALNPKKGMPSFWKRPRRGCCMNPIVAGCHSLGRRRDGCQSGLEIESFGKGSRRYRV